MRKPRDSARSASRLSSTATFLRKRLARHNRRAFGLALGTLVFALLFWAGLYFLTCWIALLFLTVDQTEGAALPAALPWIFAAVALGLVALAAVLRWRAAEQLPPDHRSVWRVALDLLLAAPRATLSIWDSLTACRWLTRRQSAQAAELIERLQEIARLPLQAVPLEIPLAQDREKILFSLQIAEIIDLQKRQDAWWIALKASQSHPLPWSPTRVI